MKPANLILTHLICRNGHEHDLCVPYEGGIPDPLRCPHTEHGGSGGAVGCLPAELTYLVAQAFRHDRSAAIKRGFVLVRP